MQNNSNKPQQQIFKITKVDHNKMVEEILENSKSKCYKNCTFEIGKALSLSVMAVKSDDKMQTMEDKAINCLENACFQKHLDKLETVQDNSAAFASENDLSLLNFKQLFEKEKVNTYEMPIDTDDIPFFSEVPFENFEETYEIVSQLYYVNTEMV